MVDNKILIELLESYIESHDVSIRDILEAVNNRAKYYFDDIIKDLVSKYSEINENNLEPEKIEENENESGTKQDDEGIKANEEVNIELSKSVEEDNDEINYDDNEEEEEEEEHVEIPKPKLKIISNFYAKDRLEELDEIPKLENGEIDYWQASKLLCEKDGGRLPTMKELAEIASYMYQKEIGDFEDKWTLELQDELITLGYYWSSLEASSTAAYDRGFSSDYSLWSRDGGRSNAFRALCVGD